MRTGPPHGLLHTACGSEPDAQRSHVPRRQSLQGEKRRDSCERGWGRVHALSSTCATSELLHTRSSSSATCSVSTRQAGCCSSAARIDLRCSAHRMRRACSATTGRHLLRGQARRVLRVKVLELLLILLFLQVLCLRTALQHRTSQARLAPSSCGPASDTPGDLPASSISTIDSDSCSARALAELRRDAGRESLAVRLAACRPPLPGLLVAGGKLPPCAGLPCEAGRPAEALSNIPCIVLFCGLPSQIGLWQVSLSFERLAGLAWRLTAQELSFPSWRVGTSQPSEVKVMWVFSLA